MINYIYAIKNRFKDKCKLPIEIFASILLLLFSGCASHEKSELPQPSDQTAPGEYFPAYPDSWWNYRNQNNDIIQYKISAGYHEYDGKNCTYFSYAQKYVWGNSILSEFYIGHGQGTVGPSPIYSTDVGKVLYCMVSFATFQYETVNVGGAEDCPWRRITTTLDTTITLSNQLTFHDVIVVKETKQFLPNWIYYEYFSKNVGLIKRDSASVNDTTQLTQILMLENYHIGQ